MFSSLYLHFPFCESKCHYCDFYSIGREKTRDGDASTFEQAISKEIELRVNEGVIAPKIKTIFLGGGTPSMTAPESMERIFSKLFRTHSNSAQNISLAENYEWTMEANPSSIEFEQFKNYRALGINRVSMGVQSLNNEHLKNLGRVHDANEAFRALEILFRAGFTNVSTDLLCGVPGQTIEDLRDHMERLSEFPITHLSCYLLTLPPHHAMYKSLPNEEEQLRHLLFIDEFMREQGFDHYEISNFAKRDTKIDYRAQHNLVYWQGGAYLGFGPSAHSYSGTQENKSPTRFKNLSSLHAYARSLIEKNELALEWTENLSPEQLELEKWMLAIRLSDGFSRDWAKTDRQKAKLSTFLSEGFLQPHPTIAHHVHATPKGFALSDLLIKELS